MSLIQIAVDIVMIIGGAAMFQQGYPHWRAYRERDSFYWWLAGAFAVFLGAWLLVTRFLLPPTLDPNLISVLGLSRKILYPIGLLIIFGVAFRQYVWKK